MRTKRGECRCHLRSFGFVQFIGAVVVSPRFDPFNDRLVLVNTPLMVRPRRARKPCVRLLIRAAKNTNNKKRKKGIYKTVVNPIDANDEWWQMLVFDLITTLELQFDCFRLSLFFYLTVAFASYTNASLFVSGISPNQTIFGYQDPTLTFLSSIQVWANVKKKKLRRTLTSVSFSTFVQPIPSTLFQLQANYSTPEASLADNQVNDVVVSLSPQSTHAVLRQIYSTFTGADDVMKAGEYILFDNESMLTCWFDSFSSSSTWSLGRSKASKRAQGDAGGQHCARIRAVSGASVVDDNDN